MKRPTTVDTPKYPQPDIDHYLVAVDLGKSKVGLAVWYVPMAAPPRLVRAGTLLELGGPDAVAQRVRHAAVDWAWAHAYQNGRPDAKTSWVCEWPKKYPDKRAYHESIDALHAVGKALGRLVGKWSEKYLPGQWKGNVPKPAHHRRLRKLNLENTPPESEHDAWDAIGIGAFALGLTRRGGVQ